MSALVGFHDVRFPFALALGARGGPERRTDIVTLGSGREERNARWAYARRRFDVGTGMKTLDDLNRLVDFFEERRGMLFGFRFRDPLDNRSSLPSSAVTPLDQAIGTGDGATDSFQLIKAYGTTHAPLERPIIKPVAETVRVAVDGVELTETDDFEVDTTTGVISFMPAAVPMAGAAITAGYAFDIPVRFDTDRLDIDISAFEAGSLPSVPIVELIL
jgi:uncharacterized protein (TIGR02217 family)